MTSFDHVIKNPMGLHAQVAMELSSVAMNSKCLIMVGLGGRSVNAKDIMKLMSLGAGCGKTLTFEILGPDEENIQEILEELCKKVL